MRIGYRKAVKRFKGNGFEANDLFWLVAGAVDSYAKHAEDEGAQYLLTYGRNSSGRLFAHCDEHYPED
jgi:hypothetical protein